MLRPAALVLCAVLLVSGCATVPLETKPEAVGPEAASPFTGEEIAEPEQDLPAVDVARRFVETNAHTADDYGVSRLYLTENVRQEWKPSGSLVLLRDPFNTLPAPAVEQPENPDEMLVGLQGTQLGKIEPDGSFLPAGGPYSAQLRLRKQDDGQWRIIELPDEVMTTKPAFENTHHPVPLYFFTPEGNVRVPDWRYVDAAPKEGLPGRVMDALLGGPSAGLENAVANPLQYAQLDTNVTQLDDVLRVPLTGVADEADETKKLIIAQIVMTLSHVTSSGKVLPLSDGKPLLAARSEWVPSDLPSYSPPTTSQPGMAVANERLISLENGNPVPGPAGTGEVRIQSAAQSLEGDQLALVEMLGKKVRLRIGATAGPMQFTSVGGKRMTRPTWWPGASNEVWTVVDRKDIVQMRLNSDGSWSERSVNSSTLERFGPISALRLSPDGTRAVLIAGKRLVMTSVSRDTETVMLRSPRTLQPDYLPDWVEVLDVDWLEQGSIVAATALDTIPVVKVSVDGFRIDRYNLSNLETPVMGVAAAPDGSVVAANARGLWVASTATEVWRQHKAVKREVQTPFFPG